MPKAQSPEEFMQGLKKRNPSEQEFSQAVSEVVHSVWPWYQEHKEYHEAQILERITEPDRVISFRVCWETDEGEIRANRGWRVQFNNCLGPYKGGLRFHPTVNQSILKFLGFEQILKNSLTGLPLGGAKGGSNFNPKGKSSREIMRFCQSFMTELARHIAEDVDVPAGDIGVGAEEIGYLFGQYLRIKNEWVGTLTGKACAFGGSSLRTEATGYGLLKFLQLMLERRQLAITDQRVLISGAGNVALHAAEKANALGAKVLTLSDSRGYIHCKDGLSDEQIQEAKDIKIVRNGRIGELCEKNKGITYHEGKSPWGVEADIALPCATQNEVDKDEAQKLVDNGCIAICEGANMPLTAEAQNIVRASSVLYAPGKASNAGGVAVSGLEMTQNNMGMQWTMAEVEQRLDKIMKTIHDKCVIYGKEGDQIDYVRGSNIGGFVKVANAMLAYGVH